jgi:hypothetical protein
MNRPAGTAKLAAEEAGRSIGFRRRPLAYARYAAELVALAPDVIMTTGSAFRQAQIAASTKL